MGCCFSRSNDGAGNSRSPHATQETDGDSLTHSGPSNFSSYGRQRQQQAEATGHRSRSGRRGSARQQSMALPLDQHYNQPVRLHVWRSKRRTWTRAQLVKERDEFWDTRVTGRAEVWAALRAAISLLQEGDVQTAQGIIDAAGITVPTGDLCEGCYDENGGLYRIPQCIASDPSNTVDETLSEHEDGSNEDIDHDDEDDDDENDGMSDRKVIAEESSDELIPDDVERRREEKGKMSERDMIKVRARLSDRGGPDVTISLGKTQTVSVLARKIHNEASIPSHQRVRIAYLGRMLKEHGTLLDQGWNQNHVVNALVVPKRSYDFS